MFPTFWCSNCLGSAAMPPMCCLPCRSCRISGVNLISVDSMAYSILMIPASPFVGAVGDLFGQAGAGLALLGVLTAASGAAVLAKRRS